MSYEVALHPWSLRAGSRQAVQPGPSQWAGVQLTRDTSVPAREASRIWRGALLERALLGYAFDQAALWCRREAPGEALALSHAVVLRHNQPFRRFCDLAHDLASGRRTADALIGLRPWEGAREIEGRHVSALRRCLEKSAQRRNLNRLMAHSGRLSEMTEEASAMEALGHINVALRAHQRAADLVDWTILGRFQPVSFRRTLGVTRATIASIYMSERDLCQVADVTAEEGIVLRARLVAAIRHLNTTLGWTRVVDAFPERLAMSQGDLRKQRRTKKGPPDGGGGEGGGPSLEEALRDLAGRNGTREGDAAIWEAMAADPAIFRRYAVLRNEAELAAEGLLGEVEHGRAQRRVARWALCGALGGVVLGVSAWWWASQEDAGAPAARSVEMATGPDEARDAPGPVAALPDETQRFDASELDVVSIAGEVGAVRVVGQEREDIGVVGDCAVEAVRDGRRVRIARDGCGAELVLRVPSRMRLEVEQTLGAIHVSAISGGMDVTLASGDVTLEGVQSEEAVRIELASGRLVTRDVVLGSVELELGSVELDVVGRIARSELSAGTARGRVRLEEAPKAGVYAWDVGLGEITLELPSGSVVDIEADGLGGVRNTLGDTDGAPFRVEFSSALGALRVDVAE